MSHSWCTLGLEDPGTVNASANGRGYAFPGRASPAPVGGSGRRDGEHPGRRDRIKATVGGGFLQILDNSVTLLVDEATLEED